VVASESAPDRVVPREHVMLGPLSTLGVGGAARWFVRAETLGQVGAAHAWASDRDVPLFVLGGGSNLVIADEGYKGLVLHVALTGIDMEPRPDGALVRCGAGETWDAVVESVVARGLSGVECLSGVPGTVGGTPIQNVGAYGQEVSDVIEQVDAFDRKTRRVVALSRAECGFAYRTSRFKTHDRGRFIVCGVAFRLGVGAPRVRYPDLADELAHRGVDRPTLVDVRHSVLAVRRRKGMVLNPHDSDTRSVGSFFMNPVVSTGVRDRIAAKAGSPPPWFESGPGQVKIPAAWLIERSGIVKGYSDGAVGISTKHPLAIVNRGGAMARDVIRLALRVKRAVIDWCDIWLMPEPVFVGFEGHEDVEFLYKARD